MDEPVKRKRGRPRKIQPAEPAPDPVPSDVPAGLLTVVMHWSWRRIHDHTDELLHLIAPIVRRNSVSACGIQLRGRSTDLPNPGQWTFCETCKARNGGIT